MASEVELTSDSLDVSVRKVPKFLLKDLKSRVLQYIAETDDFSAHIHHIDGQTTKLVFSLGAELAQPEEATSEVEMDAKKTNTISVKNIPSSVDEDLLEIFFESKKKQGGGPVKSVKLFREKNVAVVEFEQPGAVQTVITKKPIKYGQRTLDIQPYWPLLEGNETIGSLDVKGLPKQLTEDILEMHLDGIDKPGVKEKIPTYGPKLAAMIKVGSRVIRGRDWDDGNQDNGGKGTVTTVIAGGDVYVKWDNGHVNPYHMGRYDKYELMLAP